MANKPKERKQVRYEDVIFYFRNFYNGDLEDAVKTIARLFNKSLADVSNALKTGDCMPINRMEED